MLKNLAVQSGPGAQQHCCKCWLCELCLDNIVDKQCFPILRLSHKHPILIVLHCLFLDLCSLPNWVDNLPVHSIDVVFIDELDWWANLISQVMLAWTVLIVQTNSFSSLGLWGFSFLTFHIGIPRVILRLARLTSHGFQTASPKVTRAVTKNHSGLVPTSAVSEIWIEKTAGFANICLPSALATAWQQPGKDPGHY